MFSLDRLRSESGIDHALSGSIRHVADVMWGCRKLNTPTIVSGLFQDRRRSDSCGREAHLAKTGNRIDECFQVLSRNPILLVYARSDSANRISAQKFRRHFETKHVSDEAGKLILRVPIACNLDRIFLVCDWVKVRLFWQPRWEPAKAGFRDKLVFALSHGPVQNRHFHAA